MLALLAATWWRGARDPGVAPPARDIVRASAPHRPETDDPACHPRSFEGSAFTVCRFSRGRDRIELIYKAPGGNPLRGFAALETHLGARAQTVRFAANAGMFDEAGAPIGLFVADGVEGHKINRREGAGNFHLLPNGVFAVDADGRVHVTTSARFAARVPRPVLATQSGPMLVIDGALHPRFDADGPSRLIRNGVGVGGGDAWFAISEEGVSFGKFARLFRDGLGCRDALFLDGSVSSLWDPAANRQDAFALLGPMLVVTRPGQPPRQALSAEPNR